MISWRILQPRSSLSLLSPFPLVSVRSSRSHAASLRHSIARAALTCAAIAGACAHRRSLAHSHTLTLAHSQSQSQSHTLAASAGPGRSCSCLQLICWQTTCVADCGGRGIGSRSSNSGSVPLTHRLSLAGITFPDEFSLVLRSIDEGWGSDSAGLTTLALNSGPNDRRGDRHSSGSCLSR